MSSTGHSSEVLEERTRERLGEALSAVVRGDVWFDGGRRGIYATDSSNYRHVPLGVVCPFDEDDVATVLRVCRQFDAPVVSRGAGTSLSGQACNVAVVLDMSRHMNAILEIDPERRIARVQPGVVLDDLRAATARFGLTFGPDPATHAWCTLGGMIGNNSCGTHALYAGKTVDNLERLAGFTYGGTRFDLGAYGDEAAFQGVAANDDELGRIFRGLREIAERYGDSVRARYPDIARRVSGYNLDELLPERGFHVARALVGTESTCVVVTEATLRLVTSPKHRRLVVLSYPDIYTAADHVPGLLEHDLIGLEGFDDTLVQQMRRARLNSSEIDRLPDGGGWLLCELGSDDEDDVAARAVAFSKASHGATTAVLFAADADQQAIWRVRESALGATARPPGQAWNHEGWEDAAVAPARLGEYLRGIRDLWAIYGYSGAWYGHFGQGCVHTRNDFDFSSEAGISKFRSFINDAADLCVALGGSLSGEHGDGQARGELLEKMFGAELVEAFAAFKSLWDPTGSMNPHNVVDPRRIDADLHYGPSYRTVPSTGLSFAYAEDGGSLQAAAQRCVGVGRCRRDDTGVMCPSYRATREERHSTRGRAKLLVEMFQGETTTSSWRNDEVFEALDLCLSCKGCVSECPTKVDMATYKAEFLSHYYKRRLRPRAAYALGLIPWATRVATRAPRLSNALLGDHVVGRTMKDLAGVSRSRPAPSFSPTSFRRSRRERSDPSEPTVVFFPDTFSDAFLPARAEATLEVLQRAGERVAVPTTWACCGRTLFDFGMLDLARKTLTHLLDLLEPWSAREIPIVVSEPSCLATFRDELPGLFPDDERAARLSRLSRSLAEHLQAIGWEPSASLEGERAVIHPHCHQRAVVGVAAEKDLLERAGCTVEVLDSGCCGLAGSFGFRAEHDGLSRRIGEERFAPLLRRAEVDAHVVMDGFSCRTQAEHLGLGMGVSFAELLMRATS